jgi:hypothetical protein
MFGSNLLDVAIGMIFVYLLLSLICSAAHEIIEGWLKNRATDLERGIRELLDPNSSASTTGIVAKLYSHALLSGLYKGTYEQFVRNRERFFLVRWVIRFFSRWPKLPSYIPARNFALALMDTVLPAKTAGADGATERLSGAAGATIPSAPGAAPLVVINPPAPTGAPAPAAPNALDDLRAAIGEIPYEPTKRALLTIIDAAGNDATKARENIENWFNSSMDRVSGWFKRRSQIVLLLLGFGIAVSLNVDSVQLVKRLSTDKALRDSLVASADAYAKANASPAASPSPSPSPSPAASPSPSPSPSPAQGTAAPTPSPSPLPECVKDENSPQCKLAKTQEELKQLNLPIGWATKESGGTQKDPADEWPGWQMTGAGGWGGQLEKHLLGWLITALAISLGAPFWFDLLNKFIVVRSTVKPHEKSREEGSKS